MKPPDNISHREIMFRLDDGTELYLVGTTGPKSGPAHTLLRIAVFSRTPTGREPSTDENWAALCCIFAVIYKAKARAGVEETPRFEDVEALTPPLVKSTGSTVTVSYTATGKSINGPIVSPMKTDNTE